MGFIADVFDVTLIDDQGYTIATTTLQDAGIEVSVTQNEIRAGKGNQLLGTLNVSRDIMVNLTDVSFSYEFLATQLGQDVKTGAGVAYATPKWYEVGADLSIELSNTPLDINDIAIYAEDGTPIDTFTQDVTDAKKLTFTGVTAGENIQVRTYTYATAPETQTIEFDGAVFAKGMKAILETVEIDGDETITHVLQYQFDSAVPDGNFSVSTASERNAATQTFNLKIIKPKTSTVVGRLLRMPYVG